VFFLFTFYIKYILRRNTSKPSSYERPAVAQTVVVRDVAGEEEKYTLDSHGFQYVRHESAEKEFRDNEGIKAGYYAETEQLLKDV